MATELQRETIIEQHIGFCSVQNALGTRIIMIQFENELTVSELFRILSSTVEIPDVTGAKNLLQAYDVLCLCTYLQCNVIS